MKWAEINQLLDALYEVLQVVDFDPTGRYSPTVVFAECPDETTNEWVRDTGVFRLGTIDDAYINHDFDTEVLNKKNESDAYAQSLIDEAYANPQVGVVTDTGTHKRRTETRRKDKADKQAGDIALDQAEKDQSKIDQKLSEYEGKCWDASDKVHDNIDKETIISGVVAIDVETNTNWPVWSPPL